MFDWMFRIFGLVFCWSLAAPAGIVFTLSMIGLPTWWRVSDDHVGLVFTLVMTGGVFMGLGTLGLGVLVHDKVAYRDEE